MITISSRGWRRSEPGLVQILEQPSLLARAVELLANADHDETALASECRAPLELFRLITSRTPGPTLETYNGPGGASSERARVIPLLPIRPA